MKRVLEPELMNDRAQAIAYAKADFSDSNQLYVDTLVSDYSEQLHKVIDLGCGPADIPIRLAKVNPNIRITAIDGSEEMMRIAEENVRNAHLEKQITVVRGYVPIADAEEQGYDVILSKDLLHHLRDPMVLWNEVKRLGKQRAVIYMMDLMRPKTPEAARKIVEEISANEDPLLKKDFYNSLCAAFTIEEVKTQLKKSCLNLNVSQASERHMLIKGKLQ